MLTLHKNILTFVISLFLIFQANHALAQHGWPIEATGSEHAIGNSFGEFQDFTGVYKHTGIDILEDPMFKSDGTEDTSAPWVIVTVGGTVSSLSDSAGLYNGTVIRTSGGVDYSYWHLQENSYDPTYETNSDNGTAVSAGDRIAKLVYWTSCNYHHLHYDLDDGTDYLNPLEDITPNPDPDSPEAKEIYLAQDNSNPWVELEPTIPNTCTTASGNVDIIVNLIDKDGAGSTLVGADTLWVYDIRWRACPDSNTNCAWQDTHVFDDMPTGWHVKNNASTQAYYSNRAPWDSDSNYCSATDIYGVVTNFSGGLPNIAGSWDTTGIADEGYSISIKATDFAGNTKTITKRVCVQNGPDCITELMIRDAVDDDGAIPYPGNNWWTSPDITSNPGTTDEDRNILVGQNNPIEVRVWNNGSCDMPAGATYEVCLGWGPPSGAVAYPLPADQLIECQTETLPAGGWAAGTERVTTFNWAPTASDVALGHHCLVSWVDTSADAVLDTPAVNWDDNRAQENVTFQLSPPDPNVPVLSRIWVHPLDMVSNRSIELSFSYSGIKPTLQNAKLHIPPGMTIERIIGGHVTHGYKGTKPVDECEQDPDSICSKDCLSFEAANKEGCTMVVDGIDPEGRLRLEGVKVRKSTPLMLEVWSKKDAGKGQFADVDVVEYGILRGHKEITPIGGLTVRFEHPH